MGLEPLIRLDLKNSNSDLELGRGFLHLDLYACLPLCSFAHACEGRSLQADTPKLAIAIRSPCGIGRRSGLLWERLIPRVGMLTTTGPLGTVKPDSLRVGLMPDSLRVDLIRVEL
uniref:Uncharacterized protein n=1 Tax=Ananas comosus var. bracteatus TaxID=296719 RepID=A0A6V7NXP6_ANACO|nr:unnamed protein product [Ananas comosus var. bracteatus]